MLFVILNEVKDLLYYEMRILRYAQNDILILNKKCHFFRK